MTRYVEAAVRTKKPVSLRSLMRCDYCIAFDRILAVCTAAFMYCGAVLSSEEKHMTRSGGGQSESCCSKKSEISIRYSALYF